MRKLNQILCFVLSGALASAAVSCVEEEDDDEISCDDGACDGFNVQWNTEIPNVVPRKVHNYLEKFQWGDYHLVFHMSRRFFIAGESTRTWLKGLNEKYADIQEGDPGGGVEFLTMHRAMIEFLDRKFGSTKLSTKLKDGAGFDTMGEVLRGWNTDAKMIKQLEQRGGDVAEFKKAAAKLRKWSSWRSEEEFASYLQTTLRLSREVDANNTEKRTYTQDDRAGAGIHNALHGMFSDGSECDVGDPQRNLSNQMFWGIHGWVESIWQEFEKNYQRTPAEQATYDQMLERFRLHMQLHSDFGHSGHSGLPKAPSGVAKEAKKRAFRNGAACADLDSSAQMASCSR